MYAIRSYYASPPQASAGSSAARAAARRRRPVAVAGRRGCRRERVETGIGREGLLRERGAASIGGVRGGFDARRPGPLALFSGACRAPGGSQSRCSPCSPRSRRSAALVPRRPLRSGSRITSYNVCYTKLLRDARAESIGTRWQEPGTARSAATSAKAAHAATSAGARSYNFV